MSFARDEAGSSSGTGDVELDVEYRILHDERSGVSVAVFPRVILPTSSLGAERKTRILLPVWIGKDFAGELACSGEAAISSILARQPQCLASCHRAHL